MSTFNNMRDALQQGIYKIINPFVKFLIKIGVTPNMVTTIGFLGNVIAAVFLILAIDADKDARYLYVAGAGLVQVLFMVFDMLDGQVARLGGMVSRFGAMYDSILDRYSEFFVLGGILFYFVGTINIAFAMITFLAIIGSLLVSYVRARAEGVGIECKVGFMQRPERVVVTNLALLVAGIVGYCSDFNADIILGVAMIIIAVFANLTAIHRILHCKKQLDALDKKDNSTNHK